MAREIRVKTILNSVPQPDPWFGLKYNMNLYRGCQHQCIYCDSRSACYGIEDFADIQVKVNALELLAEALPRKRVIGTIGTGSMNDPYMPVERQYHLTGRALALIAANGFPVHVLTKSDLVLKDLDALRQISAVYAAVTFTITTADDDLGRKVEPGAPPVSARLKAMETLAQHGLLTGVAMMPILPFIEDSLENVLAIARLARDHGATYLLPWMGMTLREGSREFYYERLERLFPGLKPRYERRYGLRYTCESPHASRLSAALADECQRLGLALRMPVFTPRPAGEKKAARQMSLPLPSAEPPNR
jgi:DNA repair photolyase